MQLAWISRYWANGGGPENVGTTGGFPVAAGVGADLCEACEPAAVDTLVVAAEDGSTNGCTVSSRPEASTAVPAARLHRRRRVDAEPPAGAPLPEPGRTVWSDIDFPSQWDAS
ncbi:hypothetical protein Acor_82930 [Acrocarpospora corrugata]|uniref:Uncharacterized protein n=1 Tax=Acrocarpospora corrugata TaxID=35763 RepID=A0A5M3WB99_9ACTN|nr:hypothetical protein Acor_82930 [Acrocarpospora corrugata]